jgi:hypothetical protein
LKDNIYFKVKTPLDKEIRITKEYWDFVRTVKHPNMEGKEKEIIKTLKDPEFIRKSNKDERVYLYYKSTGNNYICVACKHLNGDGFIITTYITDRLKEGEEIWRKS